ncbi:hypothetical protein B0J18DRAFT_459643 [Chaetomium sp. MPI-SDFR-AT-0129]|nr:hypothetical protein B0J18DRAFT_459643 [Chaetomium sp. MPI-SDFR-AT-0129]
MDTPNQLHTSLASTTIPLPSLTWLQTLVSSRATPLPPLASLLATARARLLASDLCTPGLLDQAYAATHALPVSPSGPGSVPSGSGAGGAGLAGGRGGGGAGRGGGGGDPPRETTLPRDVAVQVLDIEDISRSRWEQVEELEGLARGEGTRGREVVRLPLGSEGEGEGEGEGERGQTQQQPQQQGQGQGQRQGAPGQDRAATARPPSKNAMHKLVLQDCRGQKIYALELQRIERLSISPTVPTPGTGIGATTAAYSNPGKTHIGEKMILRAGTVIARGVVLLDPAKCVFLGGKVEAWHRAWVDGRLARLKEGAREEGE